MAKSAAPVLDEPETPACPLGLDPPYDPANYGQPTAADAEPPQWWPDVEVGDTVLRWKEDQRPENPSVAIVTGVRPKGVLALSVFVAGATRLDTNDTTAVHHCDEPGLMEKAHRLRYGRWDLRPQDKRRREEHAELLERVRLLEQRVDKLKNKPFTKPKSDDE